MRIHRRTHMHRHSLAWCPPITPTYAPMHLHAYIPMHTRSYAPVHTCTHAHMHTCTRAHMHTCTHAHMHTCTLAHSPQPTLTVISHKSTLNGNLRPQPVRCRWAPMHLCTYIFSTYAPMHPTGTPPAPYGEHFLPSLLPYLLTYSLTYPLTYLPTYLPTNVPTYLHTYSLTYLLTYLPMVSRHSLLPCAARSRLEVLHRVEQRQHRGNRA
jgi:hypothetical protein